LCSIAVGYAVGSPVSCAATAAGSSPFALPVGRERVERRVDVLERAVLHRRREEVFRRGGIAGDRLRLFGELADRLEEVLLHMLVQVGAPAHHRARERAEHRGLVDAFTQRLAVRGVLEHLFLNRLRELFDKALPQPRRRGLARRARGAPSDSPPRRPSTCRCRQTRGARRACRQTSRWRRRPRQRPRRRAACFAVVRPVGEAARVDSSAPPACDSPSPSAPGHGWHERHHARAPAAVPESNSGNDSKTECAITDGFDNAATAVAIAPSASCTDRNAPCCAFE
jgi:hypothetical protein